VNREGSKRTLAFISVEVSLGSLRRCTPALIGALLASACQDPAPTTGSLVVTVSGLPSGATGSVRVSGPNQFYQLVQATTTIENLAPGDYAVVRDTILFSTTKYGVADIVDSVTIVRGEIQNASANYQIASGSLAVTVDGLPPGAAASILVRGPLCNPSCLPTFGSTVGASGTLEGLQPGSYEILADTTATAEGDRFAASKLVDTVSVAASLTPAAASVTYAIASGTLSVTVDGLPVSTTAALVTVTGPDSYQQALTQSTVLRGLVAGTYSISATNFNGTCPDVYTPADPQQSRDVTVGTTSSATVTYTHSQASAASLNLKVERMYVTQATQTLNGTVPILGGKTALLRVFVTANQCNTATPNVRITINGGAPVTVPASEDSVRQSPFEGSLLASWNVTIPAGTVQAGLSLSVLAEVDPTNAIPETNEGDNSASRTIDVRTAPAVQVRFVPVVTPPTGLTGVVNASNVDQFLEWPLKLHPVGTYNWDIHDVFTSARTEPLQANNTNGAWGLVLGEINALRTAEVGNPSPIYYYGVVRTTYSSGVVGIAYVGGIKVGLGWDEVSTITTQNRGSTVMAHELGHNYGREHAPCGGPLGIDQDYPYAGGRIGVYGWDPTDGLKSPSVYCDIMGYSNSYWISDYTYLAIFNRLSGAPSVQSATAASVPSLLIWGRIEKGQPILEPAFEISAPSRMPAAGPHRLIMTDATGGEILSIAFASDKIADLPGDDETFAFTVPISALRGRDLATLSLTARGKTVRSAAATDVAADPGVTMTRAGAGKLRVRWDAARFPVVMVRDPVRGQVLSFARGGDATIATNRSELDLNFSNRVRSSRRLTQLK
jgi:hypothetical protein